MVRELSPFDIRTVPELARLVNESRRSGRPRRLRDATGDVALLVPTPRRRHGATRRTDPAAFLAAAGSWEGLLDPEQFKRDLREAAGSDRPPIRL